ncbi:MAG: UDP-2,3-diacylglucosamine diphosphatase [Gammaproteobacteria bacterium]|nr:UDP-2,3-diacylglucosamine diphosphatase [Gammaproteobacteria bacterium]|tara:strand:+ start:588 stop:1331 length:744 start_codon:yes stop_codon:yes gene_type:complete
MSTLFISDLHLDQSRPNVIDFFIKYLSNIEKNITSIYILGDLVEYWVGDDDPAIGLNKVFETIHKVSHNTPIYFMQGNRDFMMSEDFCTKYGIKLLNDPTIINLNSKKILLMHGDTLCTDDIEYQKYRKLVRSEKWQNEMKTKTLEERLSIANELRKKSKLETKEKEDQIMDVNQDSVNDVIKKYDVDILIHGHTHRPNIHQIDIEGKSVQRIVLGDWYKSAYFYIYDNGKNIIHKQNLGIKKDHNS